MVHESRALRTTDISFLLLIDETFYFTMPVERWVSLQSQLFGQSNLRAASLSIFE